MGGFSSPAHNPAAASPVAAGPPASDAGPNRAGAGWCPRQDSNLHSLAGNGS